MAGPVQQYRDAARGLSRDARLLILAGALNSLPFGALAVALPIYLSFLGHPEWVIGAAFSIVGGTAVVLTIPLGIVADRFGRKRMLIVGGIAGAAAFLLLLGADSLVILYAAAFVGGVSESMFFAPLQALLAEASTPKNRTTVFGLSFFAGGVATALASFASSAPDFLRSAGWGVKEAYAPLLIAVALALLAGPVILTRVSLPETRKSERAPLLPRKSLRILSKFFAANMIIGLGAGLIVPIFSLWFFLKFGQTESFIGPLFGIGAATNALANLAAPILARRFGMVRAVVGLQAAGTFLLLSMALTTVLPLAGVLYLARNAAMNMTWPVMSAFLMGVVDPDERSSASAVVGVSFRFPFAISTAFGAAMMAQSVDLPLLITTVLYAIGTVAFFAFFRKVPEEPTD